MIYWPIVETLNEKLPEFAPLSERECEVLMWLTVDPGDGTLGGMRVVVDTPELRVAAADLVRSIRASHEA